MTESSEVDISKNLLISLNKITEIMLKNYNSALTLIIKEITEQLEVTKGQIFRKNLRNNTFTAVAQYDSFTQKTDCPNLFDITTLSSEWDDLLNEDERIIIPDINKVDTEQSLMAYLLNNGIKSLIIFPIFVSDQLFGYLRLDDCFEEKNYNNNELLYLDSVKNIIKTFFDKKDQEQYLNIKDFEKLLNLINDSAVIFHKNGIIIKANSEYSKRHNKTSNELEGTYVWSDFPDDIFKNRMSIVQKVIETGRPAVGEDLIGEEWYNYRIYPIKDELGNIIQLAAFSRDITKLINAYKQLKYQKKRYLALFDNMKCCAAVYEAVNNGENFIIKDINKSGEKLDKVEREQVVGKVITDVFPGVKKFGLFDTLKRVFETGIPEELPLGLYYDKRIEGWRNNYVYKLPSNEIVAMYLDFSKLKQTENELLESKKYLELAIQGTDAGIWEWDIEKDILNCSEKWAKIIGYKLEELAPINKQKWFEICHPDDLKKINQLLNIHLEGKSSLYEIEIRLKHKDGHWVWVLDRGSIVKTDKNGKPIFMAGTHIDISNLKAIELERDQHLTRLEKILNEIVNAICTVVDIRDPYTAGHQTKVAELSEKIAREMKLEEEVVKKIIIAAKLHDIGKIYISDEILNKNGRLNPEEFEIIKSHVEKGYEILNNITLPDKVADIVRQHHERLDGSGYPLGLKGDKILPEALILAVADVVDAVTSDRPYRKALSIETALKEIRNNSGTLYDPAVVEACGKIFLNV